MTPTCLSESSSKPCGITSSTPTIGIIGGGIAGASIALRLSELGIKVTLIEQGPSLVNGPPICHLHAGGNLYREISQQQCITLLKQSVEVLRLYDKAVDYRPTVIAVPTKDSGVPTDLLGRLKVLQQQYQNLIEQDPENKVLGEPADYYQLFSRCELERLAKCPVVANPATLSQWIIPFAKAVNLDQLKFPVIMVQEYGLSVFRLAATASLALERLSSCQVLTHTKVTAIDPVTTGEGWCVTTELTQEQTQVPDNTTPITKKVKFDYLINACGFKTGSIDDLIGEQRQRMVEFKAAYVTHWPDSQTIWPEVIFYGKRGTPNGMAQLTPYPDGFFQIHGMTQDITLFDQGLVATSADSAQPQLAAKFINKITQQWPAAVARQRTEKSISYMANFIPSFASAQMGGKPLFGAQQIPGNESELRTADVTFGRYRYARCEIVKASSVLTSANAIINHLVDLKIIARPAQPAHYFPVTMSLSEQQISTRASELALQRHYPVALAKRNRAI